MNTIIITTIAIPILVTIAAFIYSYMVIKNTKMEDPQNQSLYGFFLIFDALEYIFIYAVAGMISFASWIVWGLFLLICYMVI